MINLLIVDDENLTREGIIEGLPWNEIGIDRIMQSDDGAAALEIAGQWKPDIILTDVRMPCMDGIEMSRRLRELYPECRIIFMSGYSDKEYLLSAIQLKALNYIEKPIKLNELKDVLIETVKACLEDEHKKLKETLAQRRMEIIAPFVKNDIALILINSSIDIDLISECVNMKVLDVPADAWFITAVIRVVKDDRADEERYSGLLEEYRLTLEKILEENGLKSIAAAKDDEYLIAHIYSGNRLQLLKEALVGELLLDLINSFDYEKIFISTGKRVRGMERIPESYRSAVQAMQKAFYYGYRRIISHTGNESPVHMLGTAVQSRMDELFAFIGNMKKNEAVYTLKGISADLRRCVSSDPDNVKNIYYRLMLFLNKQMEKYGYGPQSARREGADNLWKVFNSLNTIDEVTEFTLKNIQDYFTHIEEFQNGGDHSIVKIVGYIQKNYMNKDLGVKEISANAYMSPAYMCTYFKHATGKTINQYITEYRIEKARELLSNKEYRISEVAGLVGYEDSNYFARLFKKNTSILPSEYREMLY